MTHTQVRCESLRQLLEALRHYPELAELTDSVRKEFTRMIDGREIMITWDVYDVEVACKAYYHEWKVEDYIELLARAEIGRDCNNCVTWDTIHDHINHYLHEGN